MGIVPLREAASYESGMLSQVLYGEHFKVLEERATWSKIRIAFDDFEGWISNKQFIKIDEDHFLQLQQQNPVLSNEILEYIIDADEFIMPVPLGSQLNSLEFFKHSYDGESISGIQPKINLIQTSLLLLNAPHSWAGRSALGIDASGFTQLVYKLNGYKLRRDAAQQAKQGEALSFIEESEPGDLAFFDDKDGVINHVGIMMKDNHIIHVDGKVRIDRIDHSGIFNSELRRHTHQLRVIKKII